MNPKSITDFIQNETIFFVIFDFFSLKELVKYKRM